MRERQVKHCPEIDAMRRLPSLEAVRWIERGVTPRMVPAEGGAGYICRVSDLVPPIFPAYAKLLHPIYEDLAALDDDLTWQEAEKSTPSEMNALRGSVEKEIQRSRGGSSGQRKAIWRAPIATCLPLSCVVTRIRAVACSISGFWQPWIGRITFSSRGHWTKCLISRTKPRALASPQHIGFRKTAHGSCVRTMT